jgi:hypothetical protein
MQSLVTADAALAAARNVDDVTRIARRAARELTQADDVAFDFREGADRMCADEHAIRIEKPLRLEIFDGPIAAVAEVQWR